MTEKTWAPIVAIDAETTGTHPGRLAWEVAMIRRDGEGERRTEFFIDVDLSAADPFGLGVGRFYERHPVGRRIASKASPEIQKEPWPDDYHQPATAAYLIAQWTHGAHLVGSNPGFDAYTLDPLLRSHGLIPSWHYHVVDVAAMALGYLHHAANNMLARAEVEKMADLERDWLLAKASGFREAATPPYSTDELSALLDIPAVSADLRHTAMGDAEWALSMYDRMKGSSL